MPEVIRGISVASARFLGYANVESRKIKDGRYRSFGLGPPSLERLRILDIKAA